MHSFHPSRGRVFFEVLCALGMAASCAGAWMQTHASALLGAAGVAALYALVHMFDLRRPKSAEAVEPQRIDFEPEAPGIIVPMIAAEEQPTVNSIVEETEVVEPATPRAASGRRSGGSRKGSGRRAKTPKAAKVIELAPADEPEAPKPVTDEANTPEIAPPPEEELAFLPDDEAAHPHIAPLFEPEPFARMPRRAFGRRGRI